MLLPLAAAACLIPFAFGRAGADSDDGTLVVTLRGLPPPSTSPGPPHHPSGGAPHPGYPAYQQPPAQAPPEPSAGSGGAAASTSSQQNPNTPPREVVGRLGVCELYGAPIYRGGPVRVGAPGPASVGSRSWTGHGGGQMLARVARGTYLAIKHDYGSWYGVLMIDGSLGWIEKSAVRMLDYNVVRPHPTAPGSGLLEDGGSSTPGPEETPGLPSAVLREAFRYLGVPYVWGGNGWGGLDCSGLVKNCFGRCGVPLPRRASEQARIGQPVPLIHNPFHGYAELRPGDRLYFAVRRSCIDHTGIYLGNGYFIHASMSRGRVGIDRLDTPLYGHHLVAARRL